MEDIPIAVYVTPEREEECAMLYSDIVAEWDPCTNAETKLAERVALLSWNLRILCQAEGRNPEDPALREERICTERALRSVLRRLTVEQVYREVNTRPKPPRPKGFSIPPEWASTWLEVERPSPCVDVEP